MHSSTIEPLAAATTGVVLHFPRPVSQDADAIAEGRMTALDRYSAARSDRDRMQALLWVNYWRGEAQRMAALRKLGLR